MTYEVLIRNIFQYIILSNDKHKLYIFLDALETKQEVESEKKATDIFFTHGGIKSCKEIVLKEDRN